MPGTYEKQMGSNVLKAIKEYLGLFFIVVLLVLGIRGFVAQAFKIPTGSMLNTLHVGDQIFVSKLHYGLVNPFNGRVLIPVSDPARGDIVVFEYPFDIRRDGTRRQMKDMDFVKRIVGLPGDTVEIRAKQVFVNGQPVDGPYVMHTQASVAPGPASGGAEVVPSAQSYFDHCEETSAACQTKRDWMPRFTVPMGKYFVLGDNRDESYDSRFWGFVARESIKGKAMVIYWSWSDSGKIAWERFGKTLH